MEKQHKSSNGFMWGMMVGGALVFLLGTEKGRKILKNLSEKGLEALENISSIEELEDYLEAEEPLNNQEVQAEKQSEVNPPAKTNGHSFGKRFFKKTKK